MSVICRLPQGGGSGVGIYDFPLSIQDAQIKSQLLYQGLRTKYIFVRNAAQEFGSRCEEQIAYLVEATNLKYFSDSQIAILNFIYAYSLYERMMNDSMDKLLLIQFIKNISLF
jgi:hypothetical protein